MEKVRKEARRKLDLMRKLHRWHKVVTALAGVVVFCTTYALILPAITMTTPLVCEKEEHTHTDECYQIEMVPVERKLICSLPEAEPHTHTDDCWTQVTVPACGLEETEGHTHTDACWTETTTYICGLEETPAHAHTDECYTEVTTYTCGLEESEGHAHTADCCTRTQGELLCHKEFDTVERQVETVEERSIVDENGETVTVPETVIETVPHVHTDDCYAWTDELTCGMEESEGHTHTAECAHTEKVLTCELAETEGHTHTEACVHTEKTLTCLLEETEPHTHTEDCGTEVQKVLTCGLEESEGHAHTDACYEIPENEGELVEVRTLICEKEEHTHDDNCYYGLELEEKVKYYCGFDTQHTHDESCWFEDGTLKCNIPEHTHTDACLVPPPVPVDLDDSFTAEDEYGEVVVTLHVTGTVLLPQTVGTEETEETQETGFELVLARIEDETVYGEYETEAAKDGEVMLFGALNYTLTYNGQEVDLSQCQVSVAVTPTELLQAWIDDPGAGVMMAMAMDLSTGDGEPAEDDVDAADVAEAMGMMFTANTSQQGMVTYAVTQGANVTFYVQYYAWMDRLVTEKGTGTPLDIINTNGGKLPKNEAPTADTFSQIYIGEDGKVQTQRILTEIYKRGEVGKYDPQKGSKFEYFDAPGLQYFNMVSNVTDIQYEIQQVWIQKGGQGDPTSIDSDDWLVLPYEEGVTRFNNRPETAASNSSYILLEQDDVIRLIYTPKEKSEIFPVDFYDYDISDGKHAQNATTMKVSSGTSTNYGINSGGNQSKRIAFGNAGGGETKNLADAKNASGFFINQRNAAGAWPNRTNTTPGGGTYGLVAGMNAAGNDVVFASDVVGPSLFGGQATTGKTQIENINKIQFNRVGDTYTLIKIPDTDAENLDQFHTDSGVWNNSFWPMDSANTWGAEGHDIKFGAGGKKYQGFNRYDNGGTHDSKGDLATSDDKKEHNSYFGMNFAVEFDLTKNYIGPLEYYFFGDDDMWAFLSEVEPVLDADGKQVIDTVTGKPKTKIKANVPSQQIVDIGGVHPSVGEYVNLWDYVNTDSWEDNEQKSYRLTFFYTERGASGSTCWMQFTLPTVVGVDLESQIQDLIKEDTGTIRIEKQMGGIEGNEPFEFQLDLTGADNYKIEYLYRNADGTITAGKEEDADAAIGNNGRFVLQPGEIMVIHNLPATTIYTITELDGSRQGYHTRISTVVGENGEPRIEEFGADEPASTTGNVTKGQLTWVTFTNTASYELPATGGPGATLWYTMGTMLLLGAAYLMYKKRQWLLREEDAM